MFNFYITLKAKALGEKNEENEPMKNESEVYKSKDDTHILPPQEKETMASISLVWLQGKMA